MALLFYSCNGIGSASASALPALVLFLFFFFFSACRLFAPNRLLVRWPPYVPPAIAVLNQWMKPDEIIASDMPWAIAWYADRRSLWVPETVKIMTDFNDYKILGGPVNGLYLTPVCGSQNTLGDILKGEYRDWSSVILRTVIPEKFPLKWETFLGLE